MRIVLALVSEKETIESQYTEPILYSTNTYTFRKLVDWNFKPCVKFNFFVCYPKILHPPPQKKKHKTNHQHKNPAKKTNNTSKTTNQPGSFLSLPPLPPNAPWHPHRWRKHVVDAKPWRRNRGNTLARGMKESRDMMKEVVVIRCYCQFLRVCEIYL